MRCGHCFASIVLLTYHLVVILYSYSETFDKATFIPKSLRPYLCHWHQVLILRFLRRVRFRTICLFSYVP